MKSITIQDVKNGEDIVFVTPITNPEFGKEPESTQQDAARCIHGTPRHGK